MIYIKRFLFLITGMLAAITLVMLAGTWQIAILLMECIWSFARFYYFAFCVIEHYVDSSYRFAALIDFARYIFRRRTNRS